MRAMGRLLTLGIATVLALTACGGSDTDTTAEGNNGLEKDTITVGIMPVPDVAPLFIARERGFFKEEGLTVKDVLVPNTSSAFPKMMNGSMDVVIGNYFTIMDAQAKGVADFRILADMLAAKPDVFDIVVKKDSPIRSVADLKGKRIYVTSHNSIATLAVDSTLRANGIDPKSVTYVPGAFPDAPAKLASGQVDAAWLTEPFLTKVQQEMGARKIADTMTGPMANFPIAGWATTADLVQKYPKTMAAFQRAIVKAQQIADSDRKAVEKVLPTYSKIPAETAAVIGLGSFPSTLNATRLQRVADTMQEYGYLKEKLDVTPMLVPMPQ